MHNIVKIKARKLSGLFEKSMGLIGHQPEAVFFKTRFGIHTVGMKYPIDILILDKNFQVVKIKESLEPNKIYFWFVGYDNVLELPKNTIEVHNIKIGETIDLELI